MTAVLQAILLGIVQGLTEFIPISSSAHLIIVPWVLEPITGIGDFGLSFDLALHLGTLVAVLSYFRTDWLRYFRAFVASVRERRLAGDHNRLIAWLLVIGSIPGALAGAFADDFVDSFFHSSDAAHEPTAMIAIAILLMALAAALWLAERFARHDRQFQTIGLKDALIIGCAQALALLPGVSRSGSTLTAGLALGLKREAAARFSFLLSAPIVAGAGGKKMLDVLSEGMAASEAAIFASGFLAAAIVGYGCIKFLLRFLQNHSTSVFIAYRLGLGLFILLLVAAGFGG
jgi:undecaprenyl-diphosphatase